MTAPASDETVAARVVFPPIRFTKWVQYPPPDRKAEEVIFKLKTFASLGVKKAKEAMEVKEEGKSRKRGSAFALSYDKCYCAAIEEAVSDAVQTTEQALEAVPVYGKSTQLDTWRWHMWGSVVVEEDHDLAIFGILLAPVSNDKQLASEPGKITHHDILMKEA